MKSWHRLILVALLSICSLVAMGAEEMSGSGVDAVYEAQSSSSLIVVDSANATSALEQFCKERKWHSGWDDSKKRAFIIESSEFDCANPTNSNQFHIQREWAAKRAVLAAKVGIIQSIKQKMSAEDFAAVGEDYDDSIHAEQFSNVEMLAKMPLFGATVIKQTESWDSTAKKYQIAMLFCWSIELERAARATVAGQDLRAQPSANALAIHDWLDMQELSVMIGPRQYLDNEGNRWFIGIATRPYGDELPAPVRRKNKNSAELHAQQMAAFSLFADVEGYKQAVTSAATNSFRDEGTTATAERFAEELTQSFQNRNIRGMQRLVQTEAIHPISQQRITIAVYGINAGAARKALEIERSNVTAAIQVNQQQAGERGRNIAINRSGDAADGYKDNVPGVVAKVDDATGKVAEPPMTVGQNMQAGNKAAHTFAGATIQASEEWILCIGEGESREEAVKKALLDGVRQYFGAQISGNDTMSTRFQMFETDAENSFAAKENHFSDIISSTRGFVSAYRILSYKDIADGVEAKVNAQFIDPRGNNIYALMVYPMEMPISKQTKIFSVAPKTKISGAELGGILSGAIERAFADSGKFIILNSDDLRKIIANQQLSQSLVESELASQSELMRVGNLLTADYIVTSIFDDVTFTQTLGIDKTKKKMANIFRMTMSYSYKILDVKTGKLSKSGTIHCVLNNDEIHAIKEYDEEMSAPEFAKILMKMMLDKSLVLLSHETGLYSIENAK